MKLIHFSKIEWIHLSKILIKIKFSLLKKHQNNLKITLNHFRYLTIRKIDLIKNKEKLNNLLFTIIIHKNLIKNKFKSLLKLIAFLYNKIKLNIKKIYLKFKKISKRIEYI